MAIYLKKTRVSTIFLYISLYQFSSGHEPRKQHGILALHTRTVFGESQPFDLNINTAL